MRLALDTNTYIAFAKGEGDALETLQQADRIYLPFIVLGELRAGFLCGSKSADNERMLSRFLNSSRVDILYVDEASTHSYARVFRQLRVQGTPLPTNDIWIAALVLQHNLLLFTRDRHFDHLPQIEKRCVVF